MNKAAETKSNSMQALWFLAVGASAALVHFLVLVSIVNITTITPAWANVGAFLIAFMVSFLGIFTSPLNSQIPHMRPVRIALLSKAILLKTTILKAIVKTIKVSSYLH